MATSKPKQPTLHSIMLDKLATSVLDANDAKALMMRPANPSELIAFGFKGKQAFEIPYFCAKGKPTGFRRFRYLEDTRDGFELQTDAKPLRYVQPPGTHPEVYLPPFVDWSAIQKDPEYSIVITEGELKAACCSKYVYPCIGLGGVDSFKSKKQRTTLLADLAQFEWAGREVIIAYDSDAHTNPNIVRARNALSQELLSRGAFPVIANLIPGPNGEKRGLDDVVLHDGPDALKAILDETEAYSQSRELHELNTEVTYIVDPGIVVVMDTGQRMRSHDFTAHAYANRHYTEMVKDKPVKKKAALAWLEWPFRMELNKIVYEPGSEKIVDANYNTWPGWGCAPAKGSVKPWTDLLDFLFEGKPEERSWFERWCALPLQQPGAKMYTASVLWGVMTGTGKSLVGYTMGRIYGENFTEIGDSELQDDRNEWAINKQFVMGDDVTGQEQRKHADRLKKMITQATMRIDQKYVPSYTVKDRINYFFTSNHPDAFFLEDDDRRNFVHEVVGRPLTYAFYKEYMKWLNGTGPQHLFHHLLNLDLKGMNAEDRAPITAARLAMVDDGRSDLASWVHRLKDDADSILKMGDLPLNGDLWSSKDLLMLYDPDQRKRITSGGLARELKRAGFRQVYGGMPLRTVTGQQRLFALKNPEQWVKVVAAKTLAEHYDATRMPVQRGRKF